MGCLFKKPVIILLVLAVIAAVYFVNRQLLGDRWPDGIASGNGRIEATEVDVTTKLAGRLNKVLVGEGDVVSLHQPLAELDMRNLEAAHRAAKAELTRAIQAKVYAEAIVEQRRSELQLAEKRLLRSLKLQDQGHVSEDQVDNDRNVKTSAGAALRAAEAGVTESAAAIEAARAQVESVEVSLEDSRLEAPTSGRVLYRLAEPGEVIPAGGKVLTLLDLHNVYMTIFLPTDDVSLLAIGDEARVIIDAVSDYVLPATVSFVSPQAQFTPKMVETREEREKLMFRVKIKLTPEVLEKYQARVKVGIPGEAFVKTGKRVEWPSELQVHLPQ